MTAKSMGRSAGALFLAQAVTAMLVTFVLLPKVNAPPGFLVNAAANAMQVRVAVLLWLTAAAMTLAVSIMTLPLFRALSERLAMLYLALAVLGIATSAMENAGLLTMLHLSQEYAKAAAGAREVIETLSATARASRLSAHYFNILCGGVAGFVFNVMLWRSALIPRPLAAVAIAVVPLQTVAVIIGLLGFPFPFALLAPAGVVQLTVVVWLLARGFEPRASS